MNGSYEEIRNEYIEGHLNATEANQRLARTRLNTTRAGEWKLLSELDVALP